MAKRIICVLVAVVLLVAFASCGKTSDSGSASLPAGDPTVADTVVDTTVSVPAVIDPVKEKEEMIIGEWIFNDDYVAVFNADHSGKLVDGDETYIQWSYNEARDSYICMAGGMAEEIIYTKNGDEILLHAAGDVGRRAEPGSADAIASSILGRDPLGNVCIRTGKLGGLIEKVDLTADNWRNYICVVSYEQSTVTTDAFGTVVGSQATTVYMLGATKERYHEFVNTAIELKNKATGEIRTYNFEYGGCNVDAGFNLDDYECTRVAGALYFTNIPEEAVQHKGDSYGYVSIGNSSVSTGFDVDVNLKVTKMGALMLQSNAGY